MREIIGKWKLSDYSRYVDNVEVKWDGSQTGLLEYKADGTVSMQINRTANNEKLSVMDKARLKIWYRGRFKTVSSEKITHEITEASDPKRVGSKLHRKFKLIDGYLVIEGVGLKDPVKLVWSRV